MKKRVEFIVLSVLIFLLFISLPLASAQTYSGFNRFTDNIKLFFSGEENKVKLALEIREKEVNSAIENAENGNTQEVIKNLNKAQDKLKIVQEKITLDNSEEIKLNVEEIKEKINSNNLSEKFKGYKIEEEKTQLTAELTLRTFEYCKKLAEEDYSLMLKEEKCNPKNASKGLEKELKELKEIQEESFVQLMLDIRSCIDDPGTCNCEENTDIAQKAKCEKLVAIAIKCEYKNDENACEELESMKPIPGDGFARSFVPNFLMNLFSKKHTMIEYGLNHSDGVPEECWDKNDKPECEQYEYLKETRLDWDEHGNFIGTNRATGGIKEPVPTMQESIPQCYDKENNFLEEKCGKITIIKNEKGLINYIIEKEIDNIVDKFENASEQHRVDINGKEGQTINEIKEEIDNIEGQIAERTFAPGTSGIGEPGQDIEGVIIDKSSGSGDDGLKPEIKTDLAGNGDHGLKPEVKTSIDGDNEDEPLPEPDLNQINPDLYDPNARAPGDTIDDPDGPDGYAEGTTAEGTNTLAP